MYLFFCMRAPKFPDYFASVRSERAFEEIARPWCVEGLSYEIEKRCT